MKNEELNKNFRELTENQLNLINGGEGAFPDVEELMKPYRQPDGSYRYDCPNCNRVIIGKNIDEFLDLLTKHITEELNMGFSIPNFYVVP